MVNLALVEGEDDIDLQFVVHGNYSQDGDEEDFMPQSPSEPEEVAHDFADDNGDFAMPVGLDEEASVAGGAPSGRDRDR